MKHTIYRTGAILSILVLLFNSSCKKNFESLNTPPQGATDNATPMVYNAIVSSLPISAAEYSVLNNWIYPITQQGIITSAAYSFDNARGAVWTNYYAATANYRLLQSRIDASSDSASMTNMYGMLKTLMAYETFKTTNYFGDMPYTQAGYAPLKHELGYTAAYDKQSDIYAAILADLKWAVDHFSTDASQYSLGSYETFLKGDIAMWIKFANSLRLYVAITMYDKNSTLAAAAIAEALGKPLLEDGDDIGLWPSKIPGLQFQWRQWSFSANCYVRMGSTMWNLMSSSNDPAGAGIFDPRCKIFFEPNNDTDWVAYPQNPSTTTPTEGGTPYSIDRFKNWHDKGVACIYSPFNLYFEQDVDYIPELMLTAAQVHFLKAEVYNRGLGVAASAATAQTEYNAGVTASVSMWKSIAFNSTVWVVGKPASATITPSEKMTLLGNAQVAYDMGNTTRALSQIYAQLWIDQYRQPWDAWLLLRRTGGKTPMSPDNAQYYNSNWAGFQRFTYPDEEASNNRENWTVATGGTDLNTTKIWIAK